MINEPIEILVTFPHSRITNRFSSIRAVARMLSGTGRASGGLRRQISRKAAEGVYIVSKVRNNTVADAPIDVQSLAA